jgi:GGDEF domain-containing protein
VLRVVNSALFGLPRPVADLNQAINLLGIKPLKLLVLGFNLPDALFAELAARELQWYWTNTLTRAVAARMLCEQLYRQPGDEAFIAGLLQDIGILVLLRELGEPYARFLTGVIEEKCQLATLEQDTLGFDHNQLSAALLARWQLPERLVEAIAAPKRMSRLERMNSPEGDLPQILHLAELLMQLVGQKRLGVLPELLEAGKLYRGMTKSKLAAIVEGLQIQVDQLAEVLSLELAEERDYVQMLVEAQGKMAVLSEEIASKAADDEKIYEELLAQSDQLTEAMQTFLAGRKTARTQAHAAHERGNAPKGHAENESEASERTMLLKKLRSAASQSRSRRQELSLLLVEPNVFDVHSDPFAVAAGTLTREAVDHAAQALDPETVAVMSFGKRGSAIVLTGCDRSRALTVARQAISEVEERGTTGDPENEIATTLSIGLATVSVVPRNFEASSMIESATRCLSAARACGISAVKSIEV